MTHRRPSFSSQRAFDEFAARCDFVATPSGRPSLSVGGVVIPFGARLDKNLVTARRLRQMYESRHIAIAPGSPRAAAPRVRPLAVGPSEIPGLVRDPPSRVGRVRRAISRRVA